MQAGIHALPTLTFPMEVILATSSTAQKSMLTLFVRKPRDRCTARQWTHTKQP